MRLGRAACVIVVVAALCCIVLGVAVRSEQVVSQDEKDIRALVDKLNRAWRSDDGADIMSAVLSDKSFTFVMKDPRSPSRALVVNKAAFLKSLGDILKNHRPPMHVHLTKSVTVVGPYGYEIGLSEQTNADGTSSSENIMLFLAKEDVGWRIVSWTPADNAEKALQEFKAVR